MPTVCALCKVNSDLKNSHILPEFFYKPIYDSLHRLRLVSSDADKPEKFAQKGMRERLLCGACELKLSRWENYAKQAFVDAQGVHVARQKGRFVLHGITYKIFKLFQLSLLWRMSVSSLPFFKIVRLGPHEEKLRVALLNEDPLEPLQYPCLLIAVFWKDRFLPDWMLNPTLAKIEAQRCYRVVINGILFLFFVGNHPPPVALKSLFLNKRGEMFILVDEIHNIEFLTEATLEIRDASRQRKTSES